MRPLSLGPSEDLKLARLKANAQAHPFDLARVESAFASGEDFISDAKFRCRIPFGYGVGFTIEQHPAGWARHLSVTLIGATPGMLAYSSALIKIGRKLGMRMDFFDPSHRQRLIIRVIRPRSSRSSSPSTPKRRTQDDNAPNRPRA